MKRKLVLTGLLIIIIVIFSEIALYIIYIFKPFDRIAGRDLGVLKGVPTTSEIFVPMRLSNYIMQADESKTFYSERLSGYIEELKTLMSSKSTFVKISEANYTLAGTVKGVKVVRNEEDSISFGYDITLKNSTGDEYIEHIDSSEAQYTQVSLRTISSGNYSSTKKDFDEIKTGDYISIKRSTNLLNPVEVNIEVDILRTVK